MNQIETQIVRNRVRRKLSHLRQRLTSLDDACLAVEASIPALIINTAIEATCEEAAARGISTFQGTLHLFVLSGRTYEVLAQPDTNDLSTFNIVLKREDSSEAIPEKPIEEEVDGLGRFKKVKVFSVPSFPFPMVFLETGCNVIRVAYEWLFDFISNRLEYLTVDGTERLYKLLRQLVPNYIPHVWLYIIVDGRLFYILDERAQKTALNILADRAKPGVVSPLHMWGKFSEQMIPYDLTFSKESFKTEEGLPVFFDNAKYAPTGLGSVERGVYGANGIIPQPLVKKGNILLGVGYPIGFKFKLKDTFIKASPQFKDIIDSSQKKFIQRLNELEKLASNESKAAQELLAALEAKPSLFGFSVNLKVLARLLMRLFKGSGQKD